MKSNVFFFTLFALLGISAGNAYAYQAYNETEGIMGCKTYLVGKNQNRGWLIGYLTALDTQNVLQGRNLPQVYNIIDNFCRANPRSNMDEAANALFNSLRRQ